VQIDINQISELDIVPHSSEDYRSRVLKFPWRDYQSAYNDVGQQSFVGDNLVRLLDPSTPVRERAADWLDNGALVHQHVAVYPAIIPAMPFVGYILHTDSTANVQESLWGMIAGACELMPTDDVSWAPAFWGALRRTSFIWSSPPFPETADVSRCIREIHMHLQR
jgi:hypothetical protein